MCGRYAFDDPKEIFEIRMILEEISNVFGESAALSIKQGEVFPTDTVALVAQRKEGYQSMPMEWGYKMRDSSRRIINARSETILEKPMFRRSVFEKKCLIPCTGFYEWQKNDSGKTKYLILSSKAKFFYLAGIYNTYKENNSFFNRFVIITASANELMKKIHPRMPLIIPANLKEKWLLGEGDYTNLIDEIYRTPPPLDFIPL